MSADTSPPIPCTLIRGDGIGPEIVDATLQVLDALHAPFAWREFPAGLEAIRKSGEAVHGSAPDIAGQKKANPTALMLAAAMMLEHCNLHELAARLRSAITRTLADRRTRTGDLGGPPGTDGYARAVISNLA